MTKARPMIVPCATVALCKRRKVELIPPLLPSLTKSLLLPLELGSVDVATPPAVAVDDGSEVVAEDKNGLTELPPVALLRSKVNASKSSCSRRLTDGELCPTGDPLLMAQIQDESLEVKSMLPSFQDAQLEPVQKIGH